MGYELVASKLIVLHSIPIPTTSNDSCTAYLISANATKTWTEGKQPKKGKDSSVDISFYYLWYRWYHCVLCGAVCYYFLQHLCTDVWPLVAWFMYQLHLQQFNWEEKVSRLNFWLLASFRSVVTAFLVYIWPGSFVNPMVNVQSLAV